MNMESEPGSMMIYGISQSTGVERQLHFVPVREGIILMVSDLKARPNATESCFGPTTSWPRFLNERRASSPWKQSRPR